MKKVVKLMSTRKKANPVKLGQRSRGDCGVRSLAGLVEC